MLPKLSERTVANIESYIDKSIYIIKECGRLINIFNNSSATDVRIMANKVLNTKLRLKVKHVHSNALIFLKFEALKLGQVDDTICNDLSSLYSDTDSILNSSMDYRISNKYYENFSKRIPYLKELQETFIFIEQQLHLRLKELKEILKERSQERKEVERERSQARKDAEKERSQARKYAEKEKSQARKEKEIMEEKSKDKEKLRKDEEKLRKDEEKLRKDEEKLRKDEEKLKREEENLRLLSLDAKIKRAREMTIQQDIDKSFQLKREQNAKKKKDEEIMRKEEENLRLLSLQEKVKRARKMSLEQELDQRKNKKEEISKEEERLRLLSLEGKIQRARDMVKEEKIDNHIRDVHNKRLMTIKRLKVKKEMKKEFLRNKNRVDNNVTRKNKRDSILRKLRFPNISNSKSNSKMDVV
jgi:hypothetical protein